VSVRESALAALAARVAASLAARSPAPLVLRNETVPQRLPPGGLVVVRDGETVEQTAVMSPLSWAITHRAEVEVVASTQALLDELMVAIAGGVAADRTLGGSVEWAQPESPSFQDVEFEGAASARAASIPVSLFFTVPGTPLA